MHRRHLAACDLGIGVLADRMFGIALTTPDSVFDGPDGELQGHPIAPVEARQFWDDDDVLLDPVVNGLTNGVHDDSSRQVRKGGADYARG